MQPDIVVAFRQDHIVQRIDLFAGQRALLQPRHHVGPAPAVLVARPVKLKGSAGQAKGIGLDKPIGSHRTRFLPGPIGCFLERAGIVIDQVVVLGHAGVAPLGVGRASGDPVQRRRLLVGGRPGREGVRPALGRETWGLRKRPQGALRDRKLDRVVGRPTAR